ncbi:DUF2024 family protein [Arenibacter sp. GZD96]|uniref:DUF2024 family protein n=1 Tax=Aurantibrevibacter litoralis TaxID=3106030 RepID=UPI002AFE6E3F|nr:DUF2024 family protein [Arenibacter sp. GZD-96]MEA1785028.1 DUF2024 family protein [Arenibacter sp. GZD-96]
MKVAIWDTYVTKADGTLMHFDIIVPEHLKNEEIIYTFGVQYLRTKNIENRPLTAHECRFCHIETASDAVLEAIEKRGYYILEMQNCNP